MKNFFILFSLLMIASTAHAQKSWNSLIVNDRKVTLNLVKQNTMQINQWFMKASGISILMDSSFNKTITLLSPNKINISDCFEMYNQALNMYDYELVKDNKWLVVKPIIKKVDSQKYQEPKFEPVNFELKVYQLKNNDSSNISRILNEIFVPTLNFDDLFKWIIQNDTL